MKRPKRDPERENRIHNEAIVDAGPDEQAMSWCYYWKARSVSRSGRGVSPRTPSRRSGRARPSRSCAWPWKMRANMTCLCRSVGRAGRWPFLSRNWTPSIRMNQPRKPPVTGITGCRKATAFNLRTAAESSLHSKAPLFLRDPKPENSSTGG